MDTKSAILLGAVVITVAYLLFRDSQSEAEDAETKGLIARLIAGLQREADDTADQLLGKKPDPVVEFVGETADDRFGLMMSYVDWYWSRGNAWFINNPDREAKIRHFVGNPDPRATSVLLSQLNTILIDIDQQVLNRKLIGG